MREDDQNCFVLCCIMSTTVVYTDTTMVNVGISLTTVDYLPSYLILFVCLFVFST